MTDMTKAVAHLKNNGIESFEGAGMLIIPASSPEEIYELASRVRRLFKEIGYEKSWQIDPYYYQKKRNADGSVIVGPEG